MVPGTLSAASPVRGSRRRLRVRQDCLLTNEELAATGDREPLLPIALEVLEDLLDLWSLRVIGVGVEEPSIMHRGSFAVAQPRVAGSQ